MLCRTWCSALRCASNGINSSFRPLSFSIRTYTVEAVKSRDQKINALSEFWVPSGGITASEENKDDPTSLLVKAGFIRQAHSGVFHFLPLGARQKNSLERTISLLLKRDLHANQVELSSLSTEDLWRKSGRIGEKPLEDVEHHFLTVSDRKETGFILSPTHEEEITSLVASTTKSYKEFPLRLFQIGKKYRDELRPRHGLLRTKEFVMKDMYTFDVTEEAALQTYEKVRQCYRSLFQHLGLPVVEAKASSGDMGGSLSHEYHVLSPLGEDTLHICQSCGYAENDEVSTSHEEGGDKETSCPQCKSGTMSDHKAIEIGHTFHLGTRYSEPLRATVMVPRPASEEGPSDEKPASGESHQALLQMGCHGIGVSRLMGAAAAIFADDKGLRWPMTFSPFTAVVVADKSTNLNKVKSILDRGIRPSGKQHTLGNFTHIVDDRDRPLAWKLKDADLVGYPITIVLGRKWRETGEYEVQCRSRPELSTNSKDLDTAVRRILDAIDPDVQSGQGSPDRWTRRRTKQLDYSAGPTTESQSQVSTANGNNGKTAKADDRTEATGSKPPSKGVPIRKMLTADTLSSPHTKNSGSRAAKAKGKEQKDEMKAKAATLTLPREHLLERVQLLERLVALQAEEEKLKARKGQN